jgi:hypothetical protein
MRDAPVTTLRREFSALSPSRDVRADPRTQYAQISTLPVPVVPPGAPRPRAPQEGGEAAQGRLELVVELEPPRPRAPGGKRGGCARGGEIGPRGEGPTRQSGGGEAPAERALPLEMTAFQAVQRANKRALEATGAAGEASRLQVWDPVYRSVDPHPLGPAAPFMTQP